MFGEENDEGIIPRVCRSLITRKQENNMKISFKITYIEIFLEKVRDLLRVSSSSSSSNNTSISSPTSTTSTSLKVREHPIEGPFVEGTLCLEIDSFEDCMKYIAIGNRNRMTASTKMNLQSSRSHAIFTLHCTQTKQIEQNLQASHNLLRSNQQLSLDNTFEEEGEENTYTITSKLNLVDLAGSENANSAGTEGERLKEGAAINKSLLTLGRVIKTLADNATKEKFSSPPSASSSTFSTPTNSKPNRRNSMLERSISDKNLGTLLFYISLDFTNLLNYCHSFFIGQSIGINSPSPSNSKSTNKRSSLSPQRLGSSLIPVDDKGQKITPTRSSNITLVPYRDSVLTYLLKESLGGNSKTTMIATIRPGILNFKFYTTKICLIDDISRYALCRRNRKYFKICCTS